MTAPKKESEKIASLKSGRNPDGTFAKGNKPKITENYGRPPECMSARAQARLMVQKNPKKLRDALNNLFEIAANAKDSQCVSAIDKVIKLLGNYDPQETKDVTEREKPNPFDNLTEEELRKLAQEK